jgi:Na+/melibiose symporter-like transporter
MIKNQTEISKRLKEIKEELPQIRFNFISIIVAGFFLGLFTNIFANYIYDDFKKYYISRWIFVLIICILLIYVYREFMNAFIKPKEKELKEIKKTLSDNSKFFKKNKRK